jgi:glycosyltransferase involved in cell wall biosynthesis
VEKMNLLFITHTFNLEGGAGGENYVANLLRELSNKGINVFVFTPNPGKIFLDEKKFNIKVFRSPVFGSHFLFKFCYLFNYKKAIDFAKKNKIDLIHAQGDIISGLIGKKIKKELKIPLILSMEYTDPNAPSLNMKLVHLLNQILFSKINYDFLVSMSKFLFEKYLVSWGADKKNSKIIPAGVNILKSKPLNPKKEIFDEFGEHLLISLKPFSKMNAPGIKNIISSMKIVSKKYPEYKYLAFGWGAQKENLKLFSEKLGLTKNVFFFNGVSYSEAIKLYNSAEILPHSFAYKATSSMSLIESMACGKPIIATDSGEVSNILGNAGIIVEPNNPKKFAEAIIKLIENPNLRKKLGIKARQKVLQNHSIKKIANEFILIYKKLLNN